MAHEPTATLSPLFTWRSAIVESDLPAAARHVALVLTMHMSERGDSCMPSLTTLARETGRGKSTIVAAISALEEAGLLEVTRSPNRAGRTHTNVYRAVVTDEHIARFLAARPRLKRVLTQTPTVQVKSPETTVKSPETGHKDVKDVRTTPRAPTSGARQRDEVWDTLVELLGAAPEGLERGRWNKACQSLKASGATPERLRAAAATYRTHPSYAQCVMTPTALAANWTILTATPKTAQELEAERQRARIAEIDARRQTG